MKLDPPRRKILTLFGTRPEVIKLAPVIRALEQRKHEFLTLNVSSSQHADLTQPLVRHFALRVDHDLGVMTAGQTPSEVCSRVLARLDPILAAERPDLLVVQGDTTTALAGALAGSHRGIPVAHVEAGLRTHDPSSPFPEEMNRRLITQLASLHLAATSNNVETLSAEGISRDRIALTGNPVVDALHDVLGSGAVSETLERALADAEGHRVVALTTHRRENFGPIMTGFLEVLRDFVEAHPDLLLVFPVHPNPSVRTVADKVLAGAKRVVLLEPLDYFDFIQLLSRAWIIVSDSGGVQEEAPTLGKPLIVLRESTERPEAIRAGVARLAESPARLESLLYAACADRSWFDRARSASNPFGDGASGPRIASAIHRFLDDSLLRVTPTPRTLDTVLRTHVENAIGRC
jgi:UDP-N-acetylglucosamine 2-epimerase (non-hydrolysing)